MDGRGALTVVGVLVAGWVALGFVLWIFQEKLLFPAPTGITRAQLDAAARVVGAVPVDLVASDGVRLYAWHLPARGRRVVLYFGGNAEVVAGNRALQRLLVDEGFDVLALSYRGYPGSEGSPSEAGLVLDALAAWDWAVGPGGFRPETVVVHGRSLGGGVAAHLAELRSPAGLVLESAFASVRPLARRLAPVYPLGLLLRHPFDTDRRAERISAPTFVVHSRDDEVIPIAYAATRIADRFPQVERYETSGLSHNDALVVEDPQIRERYLAFLARVAPPP